MKKVNCIRSMTRIFLTFLTIALFACQDDINQENFNLGESFVLHNGYTSSQIDGDLSIRFKRVDHDSRCPEPAQCFWRGIGVVRLELTDGSHSQDFQLATYDFDTLRSDTSFLNHRITLEQMRPYPKMDDEIKSEAYHLLIRIDTESGFELH